MDSRHESTDFELYPLSPRVLFTPHDRSSSEPQQVHISTAGIDNIRVTWITDDQTTLSTVEYGTEPGNYAAKVSGDRSSYQFLTYRSGSIHHVRIGPLKPNTTYYYRCGGGGGGPEFSLKTPPSEFPVEFAVVGDLGQSEWTKSTLQGLDGKDYDVVLLPGDLSYADGRQPLWDSFGRLVEPQASRRPWMVTEGNHEMEGFEFDVDDQFMSYNARWLMPHKQSGSTSNLYYSFDVAGAHVVMLDSCTDSGPGSDQYEWLVADLAGIDRKKTPWLIVSMHMPWYNTNYEHQGDGESMRVAMEEILYNARADIVFAGHVHAYERFTRVYNNESNSSGPIYITIGTGRCQGGTDSLYMSPVSPLSVYRDPSFGHGRLRILDEKRAYWSWHRNESNDGSHSEVADEVWLSCLSTMSADERCCK